MSNPGATVTRRLRAPLLLFAVLLIAYNPVEPWILSLLPPEGYWFVRLAPDACIALAVGATLIVGLRYRNAAWWVLAGLTVAAATLFALDVARGEGASDTINAIRVLVRYPAIGIVVWSWADDADLLQRRLSAAILFAGAVQIAAAAAELVSGFASSGLPIAPLAGTTGRYDRLGMLLAVVVILVLAGDRVSGRRWERAVPLLALVFLFLSTSRQAELGLAAGALLLAVMPLAGRQQRVTAVGTALLAVAMIAWTPSAVLRPAQQPGTGGTGGSPGQSPPASANPQPAVPSGGSVATGAPSAATVAKGSSELSLDPNRNFRLYLNFVVAPWAVVQEPLLGLGPGAHSGSTADPRLIAKLEADGVDWSYANRFMNDSNYATLLIQFGLAATALFLALLAAPLVVVVRQARRVREPVLRFAAAAGVAMAVAAAFGPAFEVRMTSVVVWVAVFAAMAYVRPIRAQPAVATSAETA